MIEVSFNASSWISPVTPHSFFCILYNTTTHPHAHIRSIV